MKEKTTIKIGEEEIHLSKSFDGWKVIYPYRNTNGSLNWKNIIYGGNIWNYIKILFLMLLLIGGTILYHFDTETCSETLKHIDEVCIALAQNNSNPYDPGYNLTNAANLLGKG